MLYSKTNLIYQGVMELLLRRVLIYSAILICFSGGTRSAQADVVDLDANPNLLGIFKGGLRPWLIYGLEAYECEVRPGVEASFRVGGMTLPAIKAVWVFKFNGDGKIRSLQGYTEEAWATNDAYAAMESWERLLEGNPEKMKEFLEGYPGSSINGDMWGASKKFRRGNISYGFLHSMQAARPFRARIYITWPITEAQIVFRKEPMEAPPGFEGADMRPHQLRGWDHVKTKPATDVGSGAKGRGVPAGATGGDVVAAGDDEGRRGSWLWWLLPAIPVLAALWLLFRSRDSGEDNGKRRTNS